MLITLSVPSSNVVTMVISSVLRSAAGKFT
jgi:hypothetical protein